MLASIPGVEDHEAAGDASGELVGKAVEDDGVTAATERTVEHGLAALYLEHFMAVAVP